MFGCEHAAVPEHHDAVRVERKVVETKIIKGTPPLRPTDAHQIGNVPEIPKHLEFYIDYEKFARDLFISDYFSAEAEGCKVYVFRRL